LVRADAAGCTHDVLAWMAGQRLSYSVGFTLPHNTPELLALIPKEVWTPAYDAHDEIRDGAWVAEITDLLDLSSWPEGMRVIVRKERPHPGAQLRITDVDGHRITAFATNTATGGPGTQLPDLELRQRRRARCEDRIRVSKDTGLLNLPLLVLSPRLRPEPDLVRHRRPRRRADGAPARRRGPTSPVTASTAWEPSPSPADRPLRPSRPPLERLPATRNRRPPRDDTRATVTPQWNIR